MVSLSNVILTKLVYFTNKYFDYYQKFNLYNRGNSDLKGKRLRKALLLGRVF